MSFGRLGSRGGLGSNPLTGGGGGVSALTRLTSALTAAGVSAKLSALYVFAQPTQAAAVKNILNPGTLDVVATNSPTFTPNRGFTGDGISMHLLGPTFTAISAVGFALNSSSAGVFSISSQQTSGLGGISATDASSQGYGFNNNDTAGHALMRAGTTGNDLLPMANSGISHVAFSRSASGSYSGFVDRLKTIIPTVSSAIPTTAHLTYLRANTTYTTNQVAAGWIGTALTDADYVALDSALCSYLQHVGAYNQTRGFDGAWTWFNDPRVIPISGVPVIGAITTFGSPVLGRDNANGLTDRPILHDNIIADDHCNPGIIRRSGDGKIIAGYNAHGGPNFYTRISSNADDPTTFATEIDIAPQLAWSGASTFSYANFVELTGDSTIPSATNATFWSNQIAGGNWTNGACNFTISQADPFGGTTATLMTADGTTAIHRAISTDSSAFTSGQSYTSSFYVKAGTVRYVQLTFPSAAFGASQYATFDLSNGTVVAGSTTGGTAKIVLFNGFYRISFTATATASASGNSSVFCFTDGSNSRNPSIASSATATIVQGQVEGGTAATPPIITVGAAATRASSTRNLYLFFRATTSTILTMHYSTSIDGGDTTWAPAQQMLWAGRPYWKSCPNGTGRIDFICNDQNPGDGTYAYNNTYHFYYQAGKFFTSAGVDMGALPLLQTSPTKIYDSQASGFLSWVWDIVIDGSNNPVATFAVFPTNTDHRYHQARWNGSSWTDHEICAAGGYIYAGQPNYSGGVVTDPTNINVVYCSRQVDASGNASTSGTFQIFKYVTADSGATWTGTQLTRGSAQCLRPYIGAGVRNLYYMKGTYASYASYQTTIEHIAI